MKKEIEIIFDVIPNCTVQVEVKGAEGTSCMDATAGIEAKSGIIADRKMKPESRLSNTTKTTNQNRLRQ